jgi:hypothetical protein
MLLLVSNPDVDTLTFNVLKTYAEIPADSEYFMQLPGPVDVDSKGNLYLVDRLAEVVFVWNADGSFQKRLGRPGQGPGEFEFMGSGGDKQGYLDILDDKIYLLNGGTRSVLLLDLEGKYREAYQIPIEGGRVLACYATSSESFLIYRMNWYKAQPTRDIDMLRKDGELELVVDMPDRTWRRGTGNEPQVINIFYAPNLTFDYNATTRELAYGRTDEKAFYIRKLSSGDSRRISVAIIPEVITEAHKAEVMEIPWIKSTGGAKANFPENTANYDRILAFSDHYLLFRETPHHHRIIGYKVDGEGNILGRFKTRCGENGSLFRGGDKLFQVVGDDEGFRVREINLGEAG